MFRKYTFILYPLLFSSCITMETFNTQVLEPATHPLAPQLRNFVLVNRTITVDDVDSSLFSATSDARDSNIVNLTTTDLIFSLADILSESPGVDRIDSSNLLEIVNIELSAKPEPLLPEIVNNICDSLESSAIISLEGYYSRFSDTIMLVNNGITNDKQKVYQMEARLNSLSFWRIYANGTGMVIDEFSLEDTMTWTHKTSNTRELNRVFLPAFKEAMSLSVDKTARSFASRITPTWVDQERYFFVGGNSLLLQGAYHLTNDQLDDAEKAYSELLSSDNRITVAAATYNIALINELRGNLVQAHSWAKRSYLIHKKNATANYIKILEDLIVKSGRLDHQLGGS